MSMTRVKAVIGAAVAVFSFGCEDVSWPSAQLVDSLRVLGIRAQPASLSPGEATELSVICADGSRGVTKNPACDVEIAWFDDCNNPDKNDPVECFDGYASRSHALASPVADTPTDSGFKGFHFGPTFEFTAPKNILAQKVTVAGQTARYGVSYVFYAVCAGRLYPVHEAVDHLPVECRSRNSGKRLGQSHFVVGFTTVYSYDLIVNHNPEIVEASFDRATIPADCTATEDCPENFECSAERQCIPVVETCSDDHPQGCKKHCLKVKLDRASFNLFAIDGTMLDTPLKSLWFDYFSNARDMSNDNDSETRALNDKNGGVHERTSCINWYAPAAPTEQAHVWVIIRDNRGGLTAWDQRIIVR
jgi:hypothetical protein